MLKWSEVPWGTVVTGLVAVYGAVLSTITLIGQRRRVAVETQRQGLLDQSAAEETHRQQAAQVSGWLVKYDGPEEPGRLFAGLVLQNLASQPVYYVVASCVTFAGAGPPSDISKLRPEGYRSFVGSLPPGITKTRIEHPGGSMHLQISVELAFQDAAGHYWVRQGDGFLREVDQRPDHLYDIPGPIPWNIAEPEPALR